MEHIININASKMYYMVLTLRFTHDYVLYMDKLYISLHFDHAPIMDNPENNQHFNVLI